MTHAASTIATALAASTFLPSPVTPLPPDPNPTMYPPDPDTAVYAESL
jgi:hypothetical protein